MTISTMKTFAAGEVLRAADMNDYVAQVTELPNPNFIMNGAFDINQRGLTSSGTTANGYGFDRWAVDTSTGTTTYSAQAFAAGANPVAGMEGSFYARCVTAGQTGVGAYSFFSQSIENVRLLAGRTVTVSFWARAGSGTPSISAVFEQMYNASTWNRFLIQKFTLSTAWTRYSATITLPTTTGQTLTADNTTRTRLEFWMSAGSNWNTQTGSIGIQSNTFDIWGVKVEEGTAASNFTRYAPTVQGEFSACQRYYQLGRLLYDHGYVPLNTPMGNSVVFPIPMRNTPNMSFTFTNSNNCRAGSSRYTLTSGFGRVCLSNATGAITGWDDYVAESDI